MKYAEYKDSSVDWIGKVPIHWNIMRGKFIVKVLPGYAFDSKKFTSDEGISLIRIRDINNTSTEMNYYGSFNEEYIVNTGDVLVGMDGDFNVAKWKGERALLNQRVCKIVGTNIMLSSYMYYLLSRPLKLINDVCYATTVKHLSTSDIENSLFPVPTIQEQHAIVAYLNEKCNKIDGAIDVQKKKIDLLNELKQTIITNAVTKGLNPNAPMKDSGVEWIGEIPEHWKIKRTRFLCNIQTGDKDTVNREDDGLYPFYVRSPKVERINTYSFDGEAVLMAGDGVGAGKVFHYANGKFDYHQRVYNLHNFKDVSGLFFYYYILNKFRYIIEEGAAKNTVDSVRLNMIQDFWMTIPPVSEQQNIVKYIDGEISKIDSQIAKANQRIELLNELKQSVITEAVTGKIKVC